MIHYGDSYTTELYLGMIVKIDIIIMLVPCKCKHLMFRSSCLSSVCLSHIRSLKLSEMGATFRHIYKKLWLLSKNMTSDFAK